MKFLRRNRNWIDANMKIYDKLENYVDARNTKAINWLKWLGFQFADETVPYGMLKMPFYKFWLKKEV